MLSHVVMFTFTDKADIPEALTRLRDLPSQIPSLVSLRCGSTAIAKPHSWDIALLTEHADLEGLTEYLEHAAHRELGEWLSPRIEMRAVVDSVDFR